MVLLPTKALLPLDADLLTSFAPLQQTDARRMRYNAIELAGLAGLTEEAVADVGMQGAPAINDYKQPHGFTGALLEHKGQPLTCSCWFDFKVLQDASAAHTQFSMCLWHAT